MKRIAALIAAVLFTAAGLNAQVGIIGGYTSSDISAAKTGNASLYHIGLAYKTKVPFAGVTIQPSLQYSVKGVKVDTEIGEASIKTSYLELPVDLQWGVDLILLRPFIQLSPFVGYQLNGETKLARTESKWLDNALNKLEYGLGVGAGLDLLSFLQLSVQYYWNFGNLVDENGSVTTNDAGNKILNTLGGNGNFSGVKISAALFF